MTDTKIPKLLLLDTDVEQIKRLLNDKALENNQYCRMLREEVLKGKIVAKEQLPANVITMHSKIKVLDLEDGDTSTYTLVYPWETDVDSGKISIFAPIGTALLGYRQNDIIDWKVPGGIAKFKILEVNQPE